MSTFISHIDYEAMKSSALSNTQLVTLRARTHELNLAGAREAVSHELRLRQTYQWLNESHIEKVSENDLAILSDYLPTKHKPSSYTPDIEHVQAYTDMYEMIRDHFDAVSVISGPSEYGSLAMMLGIMINRGGETEYFIIAEWADSKNAFVSCAEMQTVLDYKRAKNIKIKNDDVVPAAFYTVTIVYIFAVSYFFSPAISFFVGAEGLNGFYFFAGWVTTVTLTFLSGYYGMKTIRRHAINKVLKATA